MKLQLGADFTSMPRAGAILRAGEVAAGMSPPFDIVSLPHDERHLRRRVLTLDHGDRLFVDLPETTVLSGGDRLLLDDGRNVEVSAPDEEVYAIRAHDPVHLAQLAWHIGNRHLAAEIGAQRILILRDHVIKAMLEGLGAEVMDAVTPFNPVQGAYSGHGHSHHHGHDHDHE